MSGFKWRRYFFGFSASPLSPGQIAGGVAMGAAARMIVTVALYFAFIALFFAVLQPGDLVPQTAWLAIPIGLLAGLSFGAPLMAYAASIIDDKGQFALVQRFVFMPMFLFSATFFPLSTYPEALQWLVAATPLYHGVALERSLVLGEVSWGLLWHVGYLAALGVVGVVGTSRRIATLLLT